ncbi:carbohydrate ABC transporter permease (plasmid) [Vibrio pelagius]|uniref:Carbohydrate ABC transporter permease n=1 Tax=Vibrio pelagius TaxID=28169 RepID=A0ABY5GBI0_VIBPE|nr:carbohydrate ABC transporter permease [Vibrio pelagius]UTT87223.1 carbohydrate ABC transporter permease [Vibrio pelagius]
MIISEVPRAFRQPLSLKLTTNTLLAAWVLIASFPLVWIAVMSFKLPMDSFANNPLQVLMGFETLQSVGGISTFQVMLWASFAYLLFKAPAKYGTKLVDYLSTRSDTPRPQWISYSLASAVYVLAIVIGAFVVIPAVNFMATFTLGSIPFIGGLVEPIIGFTWQHYQAVWLENGFYNQFTNSMIVTAGVVCISLSIGTLAGYALSRTNSNLAFWLLIIALILRALPHSVLVAGYLPAFINSSEMLAPLWESAWTGWFFGLFSDAAPTLYGKPMAIIIVLVAINQPFTIWMLRSFFQNIPQDLDEAAMVDGCTRFEAFRRAVLPVAWPGIITAGLFSFLLGYNDFLVTSLLLDAQSQTMVPAISQYFNRETTMTDQVEAVAAAVSITAPLFLLVIVFQKQIVSGLTQGAVKG